MLLSRSARIGICFLDVLKKMGHFPEVQENFTGHRSYGYPFLGQCAESCYNSAMLFNSTRFIVFFAVAVTCYFAIPRRFRWCFLLAASYYFYACWKPGYAVLIVFSTLVDYAAGLLMGATSDTRVRRRYLILSLCSNLGLLFFFKYYNFFNDALQPIFAHIGLHLPASHFLLPVGLSFYTFQSLTYTIGVYRGIVQPERHLGVFACFVCFFPQLVAGPIERAQNLIPQFREAHTFDYARVSDGLKLMAWGLFKKVVIADRIAVLVDQVYSHPSQYPGVGVTLATVFFAFQIFCDFSGYSDMAVGAAQVLGFRLTINFGRPYFATSAADFWRRWHISLSTWFRDFVYIPLGGNRTGALRWTANIATVFLLSGLWHGANWTFPIWGALHGGYMIAGRFLRPFRASAVQVLRLDRAPWLLRALQTAFTFALVCFAWIFFRASSLDNAIEVIGNLFRGWGVIAQPARLWDTLLSMGLERDDFLIAVAMMAVVAGVHVFQETRGSVRAALSRQPVWVRWSAYSALLWSIFLFGVFQHKEFIYFTF